TIDALVTDKEFAISVEAARDKARQFLAFRAACDRADVRKSLAGLEPFAAALDRSADPRQALVEVLRRRHRVQSGKLDGGVPKRDWLNLTGNNSLLRPSPRFQRSKRPPLPTASRLTHPYRLEQFVFMLGENDLLPRSADTRRRSWLG